MELKESDKEKLVMQAKHFQRYCDLLIKQCENWLDAPDYGEINKKSCWKSLMEKIKQKNTTLFIIIGLFVSLLSSANTIDSLYRAFKDASNKKERLNVSNYINDYMFENQYKSKKIIYDESLTNEKLEEKITNDLALCAYQESEYKTVLNLGEEGIRLSTLLGDSVGIADDYGLLSNASQALGSGEKSLDYLQKAIEIQKKIGDDYGLGISYHNLGQIYYLNGFSDVAIMHLKNALNLARQVKQKRFEAQCLGTIGDILNDQGKHEEAMQNIEASLDLYRELNIHIGLVTAYIQRAEVNLKLKKTALAEESLNQAYHICDSIDDREMMAYTFMTYGELRMAQNRKIEAEEAFKKGISISEEIENVEILRCIYKSMYQLNKDIDKNRAFDALEKYFEIEEKHYNADLQQDITNYHYRIATEDKETQIALKNAQLGREKIIRSALAAIALACLMLFLVTNYYRSIVKKQNSELREMNATKDKFFSIISHDLKNPALAQRNVLQMIVDNFELMDENMLRSQFLLLLQSSDSQVELLHNLLGWAQMQTGRMPYRESLFDVTSVVNEIEELMKVPMLDKKIRFKSIFSGESTINGDRNMIATIIRNLVSNAIKFTPKGGCLCVEILVHNCNSFRIAITDTGVGLDEKTIHQLFCIDKRSSRLGTEGEQGSGLGLIVCREMAQKNGGMLTVESKVDEGATFIFTVDRKKTMN